MEKILLVINAHKPCTSMITFACNIARLAQTRVTGLFIETAESELAPEAEFYEPRLFKRMDKRSENIPVTTDKEHAVRIFRDQCRIQQVEEEVYLDKGDPVREIIFESRFADLLILDPHINFNESGRHFPSSLVKEILSESECPVLLAPERSPEIEEIVFCYDGSASSVFAIKQFTYLFPEFSSRPALLLEVSRTGQVEFDEAHRRMLAWLRAHYHSAYYHVLEGNTEDELFVYFFMKRKKMVVMGAYGRKLIAGLFRKSNADVLIRAVDLPLFVSHH